MPKFQASDDQVGKLDRALSFPQGMSRIACLDGQDLWMDMVHFDSGYFICTKLSLDAARRDPLGRCYDCDQRGDTPKQDAVTRILQYKITDKGTPQYPAEDPNLYAVRFIRFNGARLRDLKMTMSSVPDIRKHDIIVVCEDAKFQKLHTQIAPGDPWWLLKGRDLVLAMWAQESQGDLLDMEGKLGQALTYDARMAVAVARAQRQQGVTPQGRVNDNVAALMAQSPPPFAVQQAPAGMPLTSGAPAQSPLAQLMASAAAPAAPSAPAAVPQAQEVYRQMMEQAGLAGASQAPAAAAPAAGMPDRAQLDAMLAQMLNKGAAK